MSWPLSQDYNEAIQAPAVSFADPDLKRGQVVCNAWGLPQPCSGTFADVYQVRCRDGSRWAVKCFTREVPGLCERYREISEHLRHTIQPFTVDFSYLEQGICVGGRWYPVVKMQWVEGLTLNEFVGMYADRPAVLQALLQIWGYMGQRLRAVNVAHCDLQHGNVLLVQGAEPDELALKLIDYDGMWVPALAGKKSGEIGHPAYQHPERAAKDTYNREVDRFPLLLIATALSALKEKGRALWEKFDNGDNMLFQEFDLQMPQNSPLFLELTKLTDPIAGSMTDRLLEALRGGPESAALLEELIPEMTPPPTTTPSGAPGQAEVSSETPPVQSASSPHPEWVREMLQGGLDVQTLESLPGPLAKDWLADVRRADDAPHHPEG